MIDCLPYTYVPKLIDIGIFPDKIEDYLVNFYFKNNSMATFVASKNLELQINNAFLSSQHVEFFALTSLHPLNISDDSPDSRYFSKQMIKLELWKDREGKIFLLTIKLVIVFTVALLVVMFIFIALKNQEKENQQRMVKELKRDELKRNIARLGAFVQKVGKKAVDKENQKNQIAQQAIKDEKDLSKFETTGLPKIEEKPEDEEDLNQSKQ